MHVLSWHPVHVSALAALQDVPAVQGAHSVDPAAADVPAAQETHVADDMAPDAEENVPGEQSEQDVAADVPTLNLPAGHCVQAPSVRADGTVDRKLPAAQVVTICPTGGPLPSGQ